MGEKFETKPNSLLVAMGPAIGECCFEVGPEVAREFTDFNAKLGCGYWKVPLRLTKD